jgi:hypothetical protein
MRHDTNAISGHFNGGTSTGSVHAEGAFLFGESTVSATTESLTGQALSIIYTLTPRVDLGESGLISSVRRVGVRRTGYNVLGGLAVRMSRFW